MIGIVVSRSDSVSVLIGEEILNIGDWEEKIDSSRLDEEGGGKYYSSDGFELREFEGLHIQLENVEFAFENPECIIFVSRHVGDTGALLTAHYTGNFGEGKFGGNPRELSRACPNIHKAIITELEEYAPPGYEIGIECTHHGPSDISIPSMFVEIGSSEKEWEDANAARAVAMAIKGVKGVKPICEKVIVGFGGGHYMPRFERIIRETDWAIGHVAADWCLEEVESIDSDIIKEIFEKSGSDKCIIVEEKMELKSAIKDEGYEVISERWVRGTSGVGLDIVSDMENLISSVEEGLRFGEVKSERIEIIELDEVLLRDVQVIDSKRVKDVVIRNTIAFETIENGKSISGRMAIEEGEKPEEMLDVFCDILGTKYDSVIREGGQIVVKKLGFSPAKAEEWGIEPGPKFGELASGNPIEIGDKILMPIEVQEEEVKIYSIE